jgi:quinol-cytochrome oxidoreductase complex cytochrome b subunit
VSTAEKQPARAGFWETRTGWSWLKDKLLLEPLPGGSRWAAAFGSLLLFAFLVQVVTGILLAINYAPSDKTAWPSVHFIQNDVPLGNLIRSVHHWGSSAMVVLLLVHLVQVFTWGAYKRPRELTWMVGVLLLFCVLGLAFTGYLLPWDQKAYWATKVGLDIAGTTPVIGDDLHTLLQGGPQMGSLTITRFFTLHAFVLPGLVVLLVVVHLYFFRLHGVTPPWWESPDRLKAQEQPFWPNQAWKDALLAFVFLAGLAAWAYFRPAPLEDPADPAKAYEPRPEWYFMFLFKLLQYFRGPYEVVGTFVLPLLFFLVLFFWPFLDRNPARDPRRRPVAMLLLVGTSAALVGLTVYAIATDVRMQVPEQAAAKAPPVEQAGPIQKLEVAQLYGTHCAACHGVDGTGNPIRAALPKIPDFTSLAWQSSQTEMEILHRIRSGNEPAMPAYQDKLTDPQIVALAIYTRAFSVEPAAPRPVQPIQPPPPSPVAAQMPPAQVYRAYCLACHDADGRGNTIRKAMPEIPDFTKPNWQASRDSAALSHSILDGKGKFMLPMKDKLGPADANEMVAYLMHFQSAKPPDLQVEPKEPIIPPGPKEPVVVSPKEPPKPPPSPEPSPERVRLATVFYRQYCLTCHGPTGQGSEMRASMPTIPDFTNRAWQEGHSNPELGVSVLDGKGTLMPAFRGRVSEEQARDLVAYVRAFGPVGKGPEPPPVAAGEFEEQFRKLEEQWNALQKELKETAPPPRKP